MRIPKEVLSVINKLKKKGFEAYVVGGCVRDLLREREPEDWDVATGARPEDVRKVFPESFYNNRFLTVTVLTGSKNPKLKEIEITTFRSEAKYTDKRHPDKVSFAKTLEEDLSRRDFTINALALNMKEAKPSSSEIIDYFDGQKDLGNKIIRAVGIPEERFREDALRMMRAVRLASVLDFTIELKTAEAIRQCSSQLQAISKERIRDELMKIIMSQRSSQGIELLRKLGLLRHIIPELEEGYGVGQNKHHIYECYDHSLRSLDYAAKNNFNKYVRMASLLHDIAKPRTKRGNGQNSTFYGHEVVGAKMTAQILTRLRFSKKDIEKIVKLVRHHLFYYNVDEVGESSVRRLVRQVGPESIEELLRLRMADRIGSGVPKAEPYKLRHLKYIIERVSQDPISVKMLNASGKEVMEILKIKPGPKVGQILDVLLGCVLENPKRNKNDFLEKEIKKIGKLSDRELEKLAQESKKERETLEVKRDRMTKSKYWVT